MAKLKVLFWVPDQLISVDLPATLQKDLSTKVHLDTRMQILWSNIL